MLSSNTTPQSALSKSEKVSFLDAVLSKVEVKEFTKKIITKIYEMIDEFDQISGKLHEHRNSALGLAIAHPNLDDDLYDKTAFKEVGWCTKALESLISKIEQMQENSHDKYLVLQNLIFNIQIPDITKKSECPFRAFNNQLIELSFKKKVERINDLINKSLAETKDKESKKRAVFEQTFKQIQESIKTFKVKYPGKNEWDIAKEMSENPLCSGLVQPLATSLKCSQPLAWALIMEEFYKP